MNGVLSEEKKGTQIFSSFKGLYICQIISLVLLFLTLIYYCVMNCYQRILWVEVILTACFVLLMLGWGGVKLYYSGCYEQRFRYTESPNGIWKPFSYIYQPRSTWKKYKPFWCHYYVGYDEMKENLQKSANEKKYVFVGCAEEDKVKEFNFFTRLDGENLDIFALIHVERLEEESWDIFNRIFETFWIQNIMNKFETKHMAFTFLLCVDEYSKELRKKERVFTVWILKLEDIGYQQYWLIQNMHV